MRLHHLAVVHQAADLVGRGCDGQRAHHPIKRFRCRQVVRHRADAAQALHHDRHFPVGSAFNEFLETAELDDVQPHLLHMVLGVEQDRHLAMAFNPRDRVNGDPAQALGHDFRGSGFK